MPKQRRRQSAPNIFKGFGRKTTRITRARLGTSPRIPGHPEPLSPPSSPITYREATPPQEQITIGHPSKLEAPLSPLRQKSNEQDEQDEQDMLDELKTLEQLYDSSQPAAYRKHIDLSRSESPLGNPSSFFDRFEDEEEVVTTANTETATPRGETVSPV